MYEGGPEVGVGRIDRTTEIKGKKFGRRAGRVREGRRRRSAIDDMEQLTQGCAALSYLN